ncbi:MMPL family transporter [Maridesulfovibrio hydrothermalis]|uniref:RND superfamily exporter n=2 Tax=Maridesulfovibrio TaxID=2794998 RepID=L0R7I6_9BACT|nr:MMPL family transporter [Maridesulfovibrio hydrothermalis]CCO22182.1 RND superfamily exporter [Maridesulfovibrio hydrothermalis AM13 = DSM 14728]
MVRKSPLTIVICGVLLAAACAVSSALWLKLDSDQDNLISHELPFQKRNIEQIKNFGDQEYMFVVIETGGTESGKDKAAEFATTLALKLQKHPELVREVHYSMSAKDMGPGVLMFASADELRSFVNLARDFGPLGHEWFKGPGLAKFLNMTSGLLSGKGGGSGSAEMFAPVMGALDSLVGEMQSSLKEGADFEAVDDAVLGLDKAGMHYFFTRNDKLLIMRILPKKNFQEMDVIGQSLKFVRSSLEETRLAYPDVSAGLTGRPVLSADEMHTTDQDMTIAAIISVVVVGLMFMIILHGWLRPMLVMGSLFCAMAWTFGFTLVTLGSLNLLSIVFALVLVGIGVDFGIHIVMRYVEATNSGMESDEAVEEALIHTGPGVLLGGLTSVCAFYAVLGQEFVGLAELGLVGGTGIIFCLIAMLTVLPSMLLIAGRRNWFPSSRPRMATMPFMEKVISKPVAVLLIFAAATALAYPGFKKAGFNYNLLDLQAEGLESVEYEHILINDSDESTWFAVMTRPDLESVKSLIAELKNIPSVGRIDSIFEFLPEGQKEKAEILRGEARVFDGIDFDTRQAALVPAQVVSSLEALIESLEDLEEKLFSAGAKAELQVVSGLIEKADSCITMIEENPSVTLNLNSVQSRLVNELSSSFAWLKEVLEVRSVTPDDLPEHLRSLYVGKDGSFMVKISPVGNVWDFDKLTGFVADLRKVDPEVTGVPVVVLESSLLMKDTFLEAAGLTIGLVSLILFLTSFSISYVLLTLIPLIAGIFWLLEVMGLTGLSFNLANFFAIPVLIAIGVDGGVHFLARWKELAEGERLYDTSTPVAVGLSFCTTMIGFGGLLLAHHRGLASLGGIMVIGSATCLVGCMIILPAVFRLIEKIKGR